MKNVKRKSLNGFKLFVTTKANYTHLISAAPHLASHIDRPDPSQDASSQNKLHNTGNKHSTIAATLIDNGTNDRANTYTSQKTKKTLPGKKMFTIIRIIPVNLLTLGISKKPMSD